MSLPAVRSVPSQSRSSLPVPLCLAAGAYLTDETNLFRCVSVAPPGESERTALLEDCRTLDLLVFPLDDLESASLRVVRPHA
jgi:hypothetical protein